MSDTAVLFQQREAQKKFTPKFEITEKLDNR